MSVMVTIILKIVLMKAKVCCLFIYYIYTCILNRNRFGNIQYVVFYWWGENEWKKWEGVGGMSNGLNRDWHMHLQPNLSEVVVLPCQISSVISHDFMSLCKPHPLPRIFMCILDEPCDSHREFSPFLMSRWVKTAKQTYLGHVDKVKGSPL